MRDEVRLVIKAWPSEVAASTFRKEVEGALAKLKEAKITARKPTEIGDEYFEGLAWRFRRGLDLGLRWYDDGFVDVRYLLLSSYGSTRKDDALSILRETLPVATPDELFDGYKRAPTPRSLAAFLLASTGTPSARALKVANDALKGDSDALKTCVGYVSCYVGWGELIPAMQAALKKQGPGETKAWLERGLLGGGIVGGYGSFA